MTDQDFQVVMVCAFQCYCWIQLNLCIKHIIMICEQELKKIIWLITPQDVNTDIMHEC